MKKNFLKTILTLIIFLTIFIVFVPITSAATTPTFDPNVDFNTLSCSKLVTDMPGGFDVMGWIYCYLNKIFSFLIALAGTISVIMIIISGFLYTTSAGNPEKVTTANKAISGAIIGLIMVILSYAILLYVQGALTGKLQTSTTPTENILTPGNQPAGQLFPE